MKRSNHSDISQLYPRTDSIEAPKRAPHPRAVAAKRQRTADKLIRVFAVLITLLLITAIVVAIVMLANHKALPTDDGGDITQTICSVNATEENAVHGIGISSVVLPFSGDMGISYQDSLCFLGDSLTAHLISRGVLSGGKNTHQVLATEMGMLNLNSEITSACVILPDDGRRMTAAEAVGIKKPSVLIVTLGTDWGVSYLDKEDFKYCYSKLINALKSASPDTRILLQSIFPVTEDCKVLDNQKIDRANGWVKEIAYEQGLKYLDTQEILKDAKGNLRQELCNSDDGIHLNTQAYVEILAYIRSHPCT